MSHFFQRIGRYNALAICIFSILGFDQLTKFLVVQNIQYGTYINPEPIPVIEGFFYLVHIGNTGAAWGMFQGLGLVLAIFALITIISIFVFRKMLSLHLLSMQLTFGLLIGGILGNLYDRIAIGHVIDFIDIQLPFYRWPAFNIADSAICVGVICYLILSFRLDSLKESKD